MAVFRPSLALSFAVCWLLGCATGGVIGGAYYAPQYDWGEFFAVTDGRNFQVIVSGNPFPSLTEAEMKRRLLPVMQALFDEPNPAPLKAGLAALGLIQANLRAPMLPASTETTGKLLSKMAQLDLIQ